MVYLGACLIAGIRLARERQVNVRVVPTPGRPLRNRLTLPTRFTIECSALCRKKRAEIGLTLTTTVQFGIVEFAVIDRNTGPIHVKKEQDVANGLLRDFVTY